MKFEVRPYYTCGSPALVDEMTALRVAMQENLAHKRHIEGVYGEDKQKDAARRGLGNIVFKWDYVGKKYKIEDILTLDHVTRSTFPRKTALNIRGLHPDDVRSKQIVFDQAGDGIRLIEHAFGQSDVSWWAKSSIMTDPIIIDITQFYETPLPVESDTEQDSRVRRGRV